MKPSYLKDLAFYGGAITFVLVLFSAVTSFGESHLKAASSVEGNYLLRLTSDPGWQPIEPLLLKIQQSGIYLAAALVDPSTQATTTFQPRTLSGQWQNQRLTLSGTVPRTVLSRQPEKNVMISLHIEGAIAQDTLTGTLSLWNTTIPFTAQRQDVPKPDGTPKANP